MKNVIKSTPVRNATNVFNLKVIRDIHIKITHEKMKLYFHFFNNGKECPHEQECVYLHEESEMCRYMENCERENCMYQHSRYNDEEKNEVSEKGNDENDDDVNANDGVDGDEDDDEDDDEEDDEEDNEDDEKNDITDQTFCNPSQSDESEADEKKTMKCDVCTFETEDRKRFERHR